MNNILLFYILTLMNILVYAKLMRKSARQMFKYIETKSVLFVNSLYIKGSTFIYFLPFHFKLYLTILWFWCSGCFGSVSQSKISLWMYRSMLLMYGIQSKTICIYVKLFLTKLVSAIYLSPYLRNETDIIFEEHHSA